MMLAYSDERLDSFFLHGLHSGGWLSQEKGIISDLKQLYHFYVTIHSVLIAALQF